MNVPISQKTLATIKLRNVGCRSGPHTLPALTGGSSADEVAGVDSIAKAERILSGPGADRESDVRHGTARIRAGFHLVTLCIASRITPKTSVGWPIMATWGDLTVVVFALALSAIKRSRSGLIVWS